MAEDGAFKQNEHLDRSVRHRAHLGAGAPLAAAGAPEAGSVMRGAIDGSLRRREWLHQLFEESADSHPENAAIIYGDQRLTYRELEARANQLARHLVSRGISRGRQVGITLNRSIELYVSILAVLKSGATYVPLDPSFHHHGALCIAAYAYLAAERARVSPPAALSFLRAARLPKGFKPRGTPGAA